MPKPLSILIVEDEILIAMLLAETVEVLGHMVCATVGTQADAVAAAAQYRPDLIIADAGLADGNGIDAIAAILKTRFTPHLFVTGNVMHVKAHRPDAVVLQKPFFVAELCAAIEDALKAQPSG